MTTAERTQVRLGLVGFGEVGSALGEGLREGGLTDVVAFDQYAYSGPFSELLQGRAAAARVTLVASLAELADSADVIVGVTPGSASVASAQALLPHLGSGHVYVDLAATTPQVKRRVGETLGPTKARLADGAIMSSPLEDGHRILILVSGPAAGWFHDAMTPWGMRIEVVGETLGTASGIKSLRTVFTKGLEALLVECVLGSARHGIQDEVLRSIARWMDLRPFMDSANFLLVTDAIHAERRAAEADMSVEALVEVGVEPIMTRATAERLHWVARHGLKERFGGVVPGHYQQVIDAIEEQIRGAGVENR